MLDSPIDDEENPLWVNAFVKIRRDSEPPATKTVTYQFQARQLFVVPCTNDDAGPDVPFCISFLRRYGTDNVAVIRVNQAEARLQGADRIDWVPIPASPRPSPSPEPSFPETRVSKEFPSKASPERSRSTKASTGETLDRSRSRLDRSRSKSAKKKPKVGQVNNNSQTAQPRGHAW